jgi:glycosyltransferase involved in cell wall biosynthesis
MRKLLSATILTKNSQKYLAEVLTALEKIDEIVIVDTGSTDDTLSIAGQFPNVSIFEHSFIGFGPTHNVASRLAKNPWILSIDSDEVVSPSLLEEILSISLSKGFVYSFPRHNEYRKKWIRHCGWFPDRQTRIYHRDDTQFTEDQVHEAIKKDHLQEICLFSPLYHYSYENTHDFLHKMQIYSTLFALQYQGKKSSSLMKAISHGLFAFFKTYFLKRGFLDGSEGFEISFYNANTAFYKYLKLAEANKICLNEKTRERDNSWF